MYPLARKRTGKKSRRKRERELFETHSQACTGRVTLCYSLTSQSLLNHSINQSALATELL